MGGTVIIKLGKIQNLKIVNFTASGAYMDAGTGNWKDNVLLPGGELPEKANEGDSLDVFIYRDSEDRLIATTKTPQAQVDELAYLKVTAKTQIGAFLDFGLQRGLFLPFREQKYIVEVGKSYLVYLYLDKTGRISCTTDVYKYLSSDSPYQKNDRVRGAVYLMKPGVGALVAVDNKYLGLVPESEYYTALKEGDYVDARVLRVREDGKLDLSLREEAYKQMDTDAQVILGKMYGNNGFIALTDKSSPQEIENQLHISKASFKRAIGRLLKANKVAKEEHGFRLIK